MRTERPDANAEIQQTFEPLRIAFAIVALLLGLIAGARAAPAAGHLDITAADGANETVVSLQTDVHYRIDGLVAEVAVHQRFRNDGIAWLEGHYILPLPAGAAVHDLKLHIGNRVIVGEIREKEQARSEFQQALQTGRKAGLVEQSTANLFRTAVANVAPAEMVDVEVGYWQQVDYRGGQFSLSFPLTFTPRYTSPDHVSDADHAVEAALADATDAGTESFVSGITAAPTVSITVDLQPGIALDRIESSSHALEIQQTGARYRIGLQNAPVAADRDFALTWTPKPLAAPTAAVFTERAGDDNYALLMLMPQSQLSVPMARELILIIDTSGSMYGASIQQAKAALDLALSRLTPRDRFNVIQFNSTMETLFDDAVPAAAPDVALARQWVARLNAGGGTEMYAPLEKALSGVAPEGYVRQIVFATDGAVGGEGALLNLIEQRLGNSRLFTVGIGSAPNAYFLGKAAQLGRGSEVLIRDLHEVGDSMQQLFAKLDHPALRDLHLQWPGAVEAYPQQLPDLYLDEPLVVVARLRDLHGKVAALGWLADSDWSASLPLNVAANASGIARLWARRKIEDLEDGLRRGAREDQVQPQIVQVALSHHLISRYTSLVAVDRTPSRPLGVESQNVQIPNATPAGQLGYAQTATASALKLLLAALAWLIALVLGRRAIRAPAN